MINENGDERNAGKEIFISEIWQMDWSETVKVKQSEMRYDNEFCRMQSDCGFLSLLFSERKWKI